MVVLHGHDASFCEHGPVDVPAQRVDAAAEAKDTDLPGGIHRVEGLDPERGPDAEALLLHRGHSTVQRGNVLLRRRAQVLLSFAADDVRAQLLAPQELRSFRPEGHDLQLLRENVDDLLLLPSFASFHRIRLRQSPVPKVSKVIAIAMVSRRPRMTPALAHQYPSRRGPPPRPPQRHGATVVAVMDPPQDLRSGNGHCVVEQTFSQTRSSPLDRLDDKLLLMMKMM
mmetsp:Transcript_12052/g.33378  ORF Transcript_12052/g.33378 Transcript_12052/m.33378 type:complete len:226 (-) Transcript_12052:230-907(-)